MNKLTDSLLLNAIANSLPDFPKSVARFPYMISLRKTRRKDISHPESQFIRLVRKQAYNVPSESPLQHGMQPSSFDSKKT